MLLFFYINFSKDVCECLNLSGAYFDLVGSSQDCRDIPVFFTTKSLLEHVFVLSMYSSFLPQWKTMHVWSIIFIVAILKHIMQCMLSNQHLGIQHLWGGMDYLVKVKVLTNTDLDSFVNNIWE